MTLKDGFSLTLFPIADRELRVSARNKATHRWRMAFAIFAFIIAGAIGLISAAGRGAFSGQLGIFIFNVLKWLAFVFACASGIFLTSDCLSEEKREGTLGLLFLTDLRGRDVVLGKLLATSLRAFYSLLAIFPVMAFSFVLGGVTGEVFQQTMLSICNALFFSLALGMAVSVANRDSHKAMTVTLGVLVLCVIVLPQLGFVEMLSPLFAFQHAGEYRGSGYWLSLLLVNVTSWCFLAIASWLAPRTWQEKGVRIRRFLFDSKTRSASQRLRDKNPVCWIISRDRWTANLARLAIALMICLFAFSLLSVPGKGTASPPTPPQSSTITTTHGNTTTTVVYVGSVSSKRSYMIASWCSNVLAFALELWLVAHVCRFYFEGRRTGFLELLWVTPLKPPDIVIGHWRALRRLFLAPVAAQIFLTLACGVIQFWATYSPPPTTGPGTKAVPSIFSNDIVIQAILSLGLGTLNWAVGLITIIWYAIWMSLTSKKLNTAMLKTFCYSKILPWFAISFAAGLLGMLIFSSGRGGTLWLWTVVYQGLFLCMNLRLIAYARTHVRATCLDWMNSPPP